jgi:predicted TIM-barrel fold metal-dependent hydrolase
MIVDCHTQVWDSPNWLGDGLGTVEPPALKADPSQHLAAVDPVDHAIVLGFKSRHLGAEIPNTFVAEYVRQYSSKMIGFAGIDPTAEDCLDDLKISHDELHLKGVTISPAAQNFHPASTPAMALYEACVERGLPVFFEQSLRSPAAKMEFARPTLLDEVAREFPDLRLVITHLGFPWIEEAVAVLGKHRHVYADVAGLLRHPWLAYRSLLAAFEYDVMDKLLFGSDFPYRSPAAGIEALYTVNRLSHGTNLITIPREKLRGIVECDALEKLGIQHPRILKPAAPQTILSDEE